MVVCTKCYSGLGPTDIRVNSHNLTVGRQLWCTLTVAPQRQELGYLYATQTPAASVMGTCAHARAEDGQPANHQQPARLLYDADAGAAAAAATESVGDVFAPAIITSNISPVQPSSHNSLTVVLPSDTMNRTSMARSRSKRGKYGKHGKHGEMASTVSVVSMASVAECGRGVWRVW